MTTQHVIDGLTFYGFTQVCLLGFLGYLWLRDKLAERRFQREYRRLVAAQSRERVK